MTVLVAYSSVVLRGIICTNGVACIAKGLFYHSSASVAGSSTVTVLDFGKTQ
jgi:hypothetical protein